LWESQEGANDGNVATLVHAQALSGELSELFSLHDIEHCEIKGALAVTSIVNGFVSRVQNLSMRLPEEGSLLYMRKFSRKSVKRYDAKSGRNETRASLC
jgi:hypothetical protein